MTQGLTGSINRAGVTRRQLARILAGAVIAGGSVALAGCRQEAATVAMPSDMRFEPETMTVKAGATVTWRNTSGAGMVHTVTCDPERAADPAHVLLPAGGEPWDSGLIDAGEEWSRVFDLPGEYRYFCIPHEIAGMIGTIVVEP